MFYSPVSTAETAESPRRASDGRRKAQCCGVEHWNGLQLGILSLFCIGLVVAIAVLLSLEPSWLYGRESDDPVIVDPGIYPPLGALGAGNGVFPQRVTDPSNDTLNLPVYSGIYFPAGWGSLHWYPALYACNASRVVWAVLGDELATGLAASVPTDYGLFQLLGAALRHDFLDGGEGEKTTLASDFVQGIDVSAYTAEQLGVSTLGTYATWAAVSGDVPNGGTYAQATTRLSQFVFYGNGTSIWLTVPTDQYAVNLTYTIDDGATQTYEEYSSTGEVFRRVQIASGLADTQHRVLITSTPFDVHGPGLVSVGFESPDTGVSLWNVAGYKWDTSRLINVTTDDGFSDSAKLIVYAAGYWTAQLDNATFQASTDKLFDDWTARDDFDVLIVRPYLANDTDAMGPIVEAYLNQTAYLTQACVAMGPRCAMFDFTILWGNANDWEIIQDVGWMGNLDQPGQPGTSSYLVSDDGALEMAQQIYPFLAQLVALPCCN